MTQAPTIEIREMTPHDVGDVLAIERKAFASGWPPTAFERELRQNKLARYIVLIADGRPVGFAGLWLMVDQAHVVTVAVLPECRRHGYGRLLVRALLAIARREGMAAATLEVRVSNQPARALYREFGFHEVGVRKRYYSDNKEDAVIMTTEEFESEGFRRKLAEAEARIADVAGALASTD